MADSLLTSAKSESGWLSFFYALLVPPRITCEFHLIRRRRHVIEPGNLARARDILPGNGSPRLKFESKDSREVR